MDEKQAVIEVLHSYRKQFEDLMDMLAGKLRLVGVEQENARQRLRALKDRLKGDCKQFDRRMDELELKEYEKNFLEPALRKANAELQISVGTIPDGKWHTNLYGSLINIRQALHTLDS